MLLIFGSSPVSGEEEAKLIKLAEMTLLAEEAFEILEIVGFYMVGSGVEYKCSLSIPINCFRIGLVSLI